MAVTTTTRSVLDTSGFIPQAWANTALSVLRNQIQVLPLIARDTDFTEAGWKGKTLNIPYPGTFTATAKTPNALATVQAPSGGSTTSLTLTTHNTVDFILEDAAVSQALSGTSVMESYGEAAGIAIAEQVERDVIAQATGLTLSYAGGINGTSLTGAAIQAIQKVMDDNKVPNSQRYAVLNTKDRNAILADTNLAQWFAYAQQQAIGQGVIPGIYGFSGLGYSQLLPSANGNTVGGTLHAVQTVTISGGPTGGTFTLSYGGQTTAGIPLFSSASVVTNALAALSSLGAGTVACTVNAAGLIYTISIFTAAPTAITCSIAGLTGGTPAQAVADVTSGATAIGSTSLFFHKNALMFASRPLVQMDETGVRSGYANDPVSGLSMRVQFQYQPQYRGVYVAYDVLYGVIPLRANQGLIAMS